MTEQEKILLSDFEESKPHLRRWGELVDSILLKILEAFISDHRLQIYPKFRLKEDRTYLSKALYRNNSQWVKNPLEDIIDKVGTRIVMLKSEDVYEVKKVIEDYTDWQCECTRDHRNDIDKEPSRFDYQSVHIVVKPVTALHQFPEEVENFISCEIQIRSLLQHAYAEIGHDNVYKGIYRNDKDIMRKLARAMALMESTDDYFGDMFALMKSETAESKNYLSELINLFTSFKIDFQKEDTDYEFSEEVFELYSKKKIDLGKLKDFISKRESELRLAISQNNSFMFKQPVILLLAYYAYFDIEHLQNHWEVNQNILDTIMTGFSITQ